MLFDAHIHLLPAVGGDPTDAAQSHQMLRLLWDFHVRGVLAMTRYDPRLLPHPIYKLRTQDKITQMRTHIKEQGFLIRPIFASEVLYTEGMHRDFDLTLFTIPKTRFLPLLFPLETFKDAWMRDLSHIINKLHLTPIICHFDEQYAIDPVRNALRFTNSSNMIYQITSSSLRHKDFAKFVLDGYRHGKRFLIGSGADVPEMLRCGCYDPNARGLDGLQSVAHRLLYLENEDFRREISFYR